MRLRVPIVLLLFSPMFARSAEPPASEPRFELRVEAASDGNLAPRFNAMLTAPAVADAKSHIGVAPRFHLHATNAPSAVAKGLTACDLPTGIFADGFESP